MGGEFGQWNEWDESQSIDWVVSGMDKHAGLVNMIRDLNTLYTSQPAMHVNDFDNIGFQWITCDDVDNSVLAFMRKAGDARVICVFNFTPVPRENYVIGVPEPGPYKEVFNSDAAWYGGTDVGNSGEVHSHHQHEHGFEHILSLTLPPLGAIFLIKESE
jgi:1,4-alpha-glucan branching enzyme